MWWQMTTTSYLQCSIFITFQTKKTLLFDDIQYRLDFIAVEGAKARWSDLYGLRRTELLRYIAGIIISPIYIYIFICIIHFSFSWMWGECVLCVSWKMCYIFVSCFFILDCVTLWKWVNKTKVKRLAPVNIVDITF